MTDRLFFALWPEVAQIELLRARIPALLDGLACKPQRPDQWHVTLEFLGDVEPERQPLLHEAAQHVAGASFQIAFDRLEHWAKPQVLCLASTVPPRAVLQLVVWLRAALAARGFTPEQRGYRPHLTLARKARKHIHARAIAPLVWTAREFALVRSLSDAAGSRYEPLARWNLGQANL